MAGHEDADAEQGRWSGEWFLRGVEQNAQALEDVCRS
jgi:hypothetical protein